MVWTRCNNRRAQICPSCSDLYARDTWQLVHAGTAGGHHDIPAAVADHPQVFVTLTAPSYGPVHATARAGERRQCRDHHGIGGYCRCPHGRPLWCSTIHGEGDIHVGQPICADCYDYAGMSCSPGTCPNCGDASPSPSDARCAGSYAPRASNRMRCGSASSKSSNCKPASSPHIHALIRLDPPDSDSCGGQGWQAPLTATELATIIQQAARTVAMTVSDSPQVPRHG